MRMSEIQSDFNRDFFQFDIGTLVTPKLNALPIYFTLSDACDDMSAVYDENFVHKDQYFEPNTLGIVIKEWQGRFVKILTSRGSSGWCHRASLIEAR